jgi:hypothetical protein
MNRVQEQHGASESPTPSLSRGEPENPMAPRFHQLLDYSENLLTA